MARKKTYDYPVTKEVRSKALADILEVLNETKEAEKFGNFKKQMLLKLANTVLPRVNEFSGIDGGQLKIFIDGAVVNKNETSPNTERNSRRLASF